MTVLTISPVGPHDFELCLRIAGSFSPDPIQDFSVLRAAVRIQDNPTVLEFRQVRRDPVTLEIRIDLPDNASEIERIAGWITFADLNLLPFYRLAAPHAVLGPITQELYGLKPLRPASLFEMLIIAVTEQQISLAAAYRIRMRIIERFGDPVNGLRVFPTPTRLSESSIADLLTCGLSRRKAEYVKGLAAFYLLAHMRLESGNTRKKGS
jgi:3-methyladenine DNA glycosylase/8-oxoguanine DNA glycosylase